MKSDWLKLTPTERCEIIAQRIRQIRERRKISEARWRVKRADVDWEGRIRQRVRSWCIDGERSK